MFGELYTTHMANNGSKHNLSDSCQKWAWVLCRIIFNVIGLNLPRYGLGHKLRQITNCDGRDSWFVAICDCCNLWRFKTQLLTLMPIVPDGLHLSTENTFTYTSDNFKMFLCYIVYRLYSQWNNTKWSKNATFHIHGKSEPGHSPKYPEHIFSVIGIDSHVTALITNCDKSQIATTGIPALSKFVTVAICDDSKYNFPDWCQMYINYGLCDWYTYTQTDISVK